MSENINLTGSENLKDKSSSDTWSRQNTLILIQALRNSPCLYNPLDPHFLNKSKRSEKLQIILNELNKSKNYLTLHIPNVCAMLYIPKLWCYNELSFLFHRNDCESSTSNIDFIVEDEIETAEEASEYETPKKRKTKVQGELRTEVIKMIAQSKNILVQRRKQPLTKEEEFCRYICSKLKCLKLERSFQEVKSRIIELVSSKILEEQDILDNVNQFHPISPGLAEGDIYKYRSRPSSSSTQSSSISPLPFPAKPKCFQYSTPEEDFYDNSQTLFSIPFPSKINKNKNLFQHSSPENSYDNSQKCTYIPSFFNINKPKQTVPEEPPQRSLSFVPEYYPSPINSPIIPEIKPNQQPTIFEQSSQTSTFIPSLNTYFPTTPTLHKIKQCKIEILDNRIIKQADQQKPSTSKDILSMAMEDIHNY